MYIYLTTVCPWFRWLAVSFCKEAPVLSLHDCVRVQWIVQNVYTCHLHSTVVVQQPKTFAYCKVCWLPAAPSKHTLHLGNTSMS